MKSIIMFLLVSILLLVKESYAQEKNAREKVSLHVKKGSVEILIQYIADTTGHPLSMNSELFRKCSPVTLDFDSLDFRLALERCLRNQPITFRIEKRIIYIIPKDVRGCVTGENDEPLAGVTLTLLNTGQQTTSDEKGMYWFPEAALQSFINATSVNCEPQRIPINGRTWLPISLQKKQTLYGDTPVVIVDDGFVRLSAERASGVAAVIGQEQLGKRTSVDLWSRADNTVAGVQVTPGKHAPVITIRGISTIYASKQPLIIVDRFPYDAGLSSINPNDIESITFLKDAAATSIWGARAGNGVIVITTRQGRYNRGVKISFTSNYTITGQPDSWYLPTLAPVDYLEVEKGLFSKHFYDGALNTRYGLVSPAVEIMEQERSGKLDAGQAKAALDQLGQQDVRNDYDKYYYRQGVAQQYALSLRGGSSQHKYYLGAGYDKELSGFTGGTTTRITLTSSNTYKPIKALEINTTVSMIKSIARNDIPFPEVLYPYSMLAGSNGSPLVSDYGLRQSWKQGLPPGKLADWNYRPLEELSLRDNFIRRMNIRLLAEIRYTIITDLQVSLAYQYLQETGRYTNTLPEQSFAFRDLSNRFANQQGNSMSSPVPQGPIEDWQQRTYQAENLRVQANYRHKWREKHQLTMLAGVEVWYGKNDSSGGRTYSEQADLFTEFPLYYNHLNKQQLPGRPYQLSVNDRYISGFYNAGFTWDRHYTVNISARIDQTNLVGVNTNHKTVPLYSTGFKWDIADKPFDNTTWLNRLSLHTSFGYSGNVDNFMSAQLTVAPGVTNRYGAITRTILNAANPDLRWERTGMLNVGLDFSLFSKRLSGSADYYIRHGNDLLDNSITTPSEGAINYRSNTASLKGHGFEVKLESRRKLGQLDWSSILLFSFTTNTITAYGNPKHRAWDYLDPTAGNLRTGFSSTPIYSLRWGGLDPANGDPLGYLHGTTSHAYEEILNAPADSLLYNGPSTPPYMVSIGNTFRFHNFECSFLITGQFGYFFRRPSINYSALFNGRDPGNTDYTLRWQHPGDETRTNVPSLPSVADEYRDLFYAYSAALIEKADNIRLREIRIAYSLGKRLQQKFHLSSATLFVYAANVGIIWKATDTALDPDSYAAIPVPRSLSIGLKLNF